MRPRSRLLAIVLISLALPAGTASAKEPFKSAAVAGADEVLAAWKANEPARIEAVAAKELPDPWMVADELLARGEKEAASALGKAAKRPSVARLLAYVEAQWDAPLRPETRAAIDAAQAAARARKFEESLSAIEAAKPLGDDVLSIHALRVRFDALFALHREAEAIRVGADAAERAERIGAPALQTYFLGATGEFLLSTGDLKGARARFERTAEIRVGAGLSGGLAGTQNLLATTLENLGEYEKAAAAAEAALKTAEKVKRPEYVAAALGILGTVYDSLSNYTKALEYEERALAIAKEANNQQAIAATLGNMGLTLLALGNPSKALEHTLKALEIFRKLNDDLNIGATLLGLCAIERHLGQYPKALEYASKSLEICHTLGDKSGEAASLIDLGSVYIVTGDDARAESNYLKGLDLAQAAGYRVAAATALDALGSIYVRRDDRAKARGMFERSRRTHESIGSPVGVAGAMVSLGLLAANEGNGAEAVKLFEEAVVLCETANRTDTESEALTALGGVYRMQGEKVKAYAALEKAVRLAERNRSKSRLATALQESALAQLQFGEPQLALSTAHRALVPITDIVHGQSDERSAATRAQFARAYEVGFLAAAKSGNMAEASFFLESGRAGSLLNALENRSLLLEANLPPALAEQARAARAREVFARAAHRRALDSGNRRDIADRSKDLDAAEEGLEAVRQTIQQEAKKPAGATAAEFFYPEAAPLEEIQRLLKDGDALVLYALPELGDTSFALVATKADARIVELGKTTDVTAACLALAAGDASVDPTAAAAKLKKLVVEPLKLPASTRRVLLSPEDVLAYAPWALLFGTGTDAPDTASLPSGSAYATLLGEHAARGERILALGDPDYSVTADRAGESGPAALLRGGAKLVRLPATRDEAKAIGDVVLLGADATSDGLKAALSKQPRWHAVHLACHGLVRTDKGMLSSLALTPSATDSGFLTAADVFYGLMRVPADLVVLSACETSRGKIVRAEGVQGLTRAFLFAGASRVVVSLWKVNDDATRALMTKFYEAWKAGTRTAKALRAAQDFVRSQEKWSHPAYWAGWALWGLPD